MYRQVFSILNIRSVETEVKLLLAQFQLTKERVLKGLDYFKKTLGMFTINY